MLKKNFKDATKEDIRLLLKWMDDNNYKASTHEKFRRILKFYYKVVYGKNECYPEAVSWFSVNVGKERYGKEGQINMSEYLEEEEVQKLIEATPTVQKKAFLSCLYESGARPEEFLKLSNLETKIDSKGVVMVVVAYLYYYMKQIPMSLAESSFAVYVLVLLICLIPLDSKDLSGLFYSFFQVRQ